jgi:hypothetical protein
MSSDLISDDDLRRSVQRAARQSGSFIAGLVRVWEHAFPRESLTASLDCSERRVLELSLCLRPRAESWASDVGEIASAVGIDSTRLEAFLRSAGALERLALAHPTDEHASQLMAARDRDEKDE